MFNIYNPNTYSEILDEEYAEINGETLYNPATKKYIKLKEVISLLQSTEKYFKSKDPDFKFSKEGINNFLKNLYEQYAPSQIQLRNKIQQNGDWISDDIKAMVDLEGKPLSRERQGKIQVIRDSKFSTIEDLPEETKQKIKKIFLACLERRERKYRIKQELFDNFAGLNRNLDDFVDYELSVAESIAYIKDEVYNSRYEDKIYFKRFVEKGGCSKCRKLKNKVALWSSVPLDDNKTNDEYADYVIWDDRFTEKKSKIPLACCCDDCRGIWVRYYPDV